VGGNQENVLLYEIHKYIKAEQESEFLLNHCSVKEMEHRLDIPSKMEIGEDVDDKDLKYPMHTVYCKSANTAFV
jgi:hypothetical protein